MVPHKCHMFTRWATLLNRNVQFALVILLLAFIVHCMCATVDLMGKPISTYYERRKKLEVVGVLWVATLLNFLTAVISCVASQKLLATIINATSDITLEEAQENLKKSTGAFVAVVLASGITTAVCMLTGWYIFVILQALLFIFQWTAMIAILVDLGLVGRRNASYVDFGVEKC